MIEFLRWCDRQIMTLNNVIRMASGLVLLVLVIMLFKTQYKVNMLIEQVEQIKQQRKTE